METKQKPATPLPWNIRSERQQRQEIAAQQQLPVFAYSQKHDCDLAQFGIKGRDAEQMMADAAYIVHACNNYGRLVEALRELVARCDGEEGVRADGSNIQTFAASAILHQLGEA